VVGRVSVRGIGFESRHGKGYALNLYIVRFEYLSVSLNMQ